MTAAMLPRANIQNLSITRDELAAAVSYCPETGVITWKPRPLEDFNSYRSWRMYSGKYAGKEAGSLFRARSGGQYRRIKFGKRNIFCHRAAWLISYGYEPDQIDHLNGDGLDNRLSNLRDTDLSGNMKNRAISRRNTSGITGVFWFKNHRKWGVIISSNGKREFLGLHEDFFDACCARKSAENQRGFHANHGRKA